MGIGLTHSAREVQREGREIAFGFGRAIDARWHTLRGADERAILSQAQSIRYSRYFRESISAYRRLDALMARKGDGGTGFDAALSTPARFVAFLGYSRSGHSLIGSLIDAHPDAVIAHELHALKHLNRGYSFEAVVRALWQNARIFHVMGRSYTGYDYVVRGQSQGMCRQLRIIGDKKGNGATRLLRRDPAALDRILARVPVPVDFIHVIRNPYDNIATKALRTGRKLEDAAEVYLANARKISEIKGRENACVYDVHLDELIAQPKAVLFDIVSRLGLDPEVPGYLDACAEVLFSTPSRSRDKVTWPERLRDDLARQLADIPFLNAYAKTLTGHRD